ncbi:hypothetical protein DHEL01_v208148 [Diaporthe helianthi]|uniref:Uncharacterized protein n=1 Tax=Diaporthe helianthi TaxID=158607 RepID=A0A2P5HTA7_DIAHE|nr:hypothetical protein DHEL01_v208148 [Diaporthe helianthi]
MASSGRHNTRAAAPVNSPAVGGRQPPSDSKGTNGKVLILLNNDLPDWDNVAIFLLFATVVQDLEKKFGKSAVQKLFILELHKVNLGIERIQGKNIPTFLMPMFNALFKADGPVHRAPFDLKVKKDLDRVLERRGISAGSASTFMRADLTKALVDAIVGNEKIMKTLVKDLLNLEKFQVKQKFRDACSCHENWANRCGICKFRYESIKQQMMTCVPSKDPEDLEGSLVAGKYYAQDYLKVLQEHGFLSPDDKVYLDVGGLPHLTAPLEARAEHPGHLVNHPDLVKFYQLQKDTVPSEAQRRENIRDHMQKNLEKNYETRLDDTTISSTGKDRYKKIIDAGKKANKIFFFGGSSMTLLKALISAGLEKKIEFVGQGGVMNTSLNLTGNSFNWDLNPSAAYSVLNRQADKNAGIPEFMLGSTELGKQRLFLGKDLASVFAAGRLNDRFGRRVAAFGVPEVKTNPEKFILDMQSIDVFNASKKAPKPNEVTEAEKTYAGHLSKKVQGADLAAFLAAYSESFRAHCTPYKPKYMFIVKKLDQQGKELDAVERVRFHDENKMTNKREICRSLDGSVTLFMPKTNETEVVKMTSDMIAEVKDAMAKKVAAALHHDTSGTTSTPAAAPSANGPTNGNHKQPNTLASRPKQPAGNNASGAGGMPPLKVKSASASNGAPRRAGAPPAGGMSTPKAAGGKQVRRSEQSGS